MTPGRRKCCGKQLFSFDTRRDRTAATDRQEQNPATERNNCGLHKKRVLRVSRNKSVQYSHVLRTIPFVSAADLLLLLYCVIGEVWLGYRLLIALATTDLIFVTFFFSSRRYKLPSQRAAVPARTPSKSLNTRFGHCVVRAENYWRRNNKTSTEGTIHV